MIPWAH